MRRARRSRRRRSRPSAWAYSSIRRSRSRASPDKTGIDERRRQMADGHAGDAAFCLRRLARIADDEGIDHRQRAGDDFGKTFRASARRLFRAAIPACRARPCARARPPARHAAATAQTRPARAAAATLDRDSRRGVRRAAAVRRQRDQEVATVFDAEAKDPVVEIRIVRRLAPGFPQSRDCRRRYSASRFSYSGNGSFAPSAPSASTSRISRDVFGVPLTLYPAAVRSSRSASTLAGTSSPTA